MEYYTILALCNLIIGLILYIFELLEKLEKYKSFLSSLKIPGRYLIVCDDLVVKTKYKDYLVVGDKYKSPEYE